MRILTQAKQTIPEFFNFVGQVNCAGAEQFGGADIRQPIAAGAPQQDEEDW